MGHINFEIPDHLLDAISDEGDYQNVPNKMVVIESLRRDFDPDGSAATFSFEEDEKDPRTDSDQDPNSPNATAD